MKQSSERIGKLMFRYVRRKLTAAEEKELNVWRGLSPDNEALFQKETKPERIQEGMRIHYESRVRNFESIQKEFPGPWTDPSGKKPSRVISLLKLAASLIVGLGALWYVFSLGGFSGGTHSLATIMLANGQRVALSDFERGKLAGSQEIDLREKDNGELLYVAKNRTNQPMDKVDILYTPENGHFELQLPEGSQVWLNNFSEIKYPANYMRDSILLKLQGEGYFKIPDNPNYHYQVITDSLIIEARNGEFNIRTDGIHSGTSVIMISGSAFILPNSKIKDTTQMLTLHAGQEARLNHGKIEVNTHPDVKPISEWKKD